MKHALLLFLLLNIYSCFCLGIQAQELTLSLTAEKIISKGLKDSLQTPKTFADINSLQNAVDTVALKLLRMGYIESELLQLNKENDSSFTANFLLGEKFTKLKVFYSNQDFTHKELQQISPEITENYFILPFESVPMSLQKLTSSQTQKGMAFARMRLTEFEKATDGSLTASLRLESGSQRTVDSIAIKGYEQFPRSFLKYYAGIKKGKTFNQKKLVTQSENLNSLGFVSATKPPEALFRKDSTIVYFYLEKQNNNLFDGILGFATNEETRKLELNGYLNLELNNNLNYGEQLLINYKADGKEQVSFRTKAVLPYLFKTPFGLSGELKIFKRDSSFITTEQQLRTTYQINTTSQAYVGYRGFDSSKLLDESVAGIPIEDFKSSFLIVGANYIRPQNRRLFPIKTHLTVDSGIGNREKDGSSESQFKVEALINNIFYLNYNNSIFVQSTTGILNSDTYLVNELFRFGGINSIRGFDENSIDASLYSVINTEYRYQFNEAVFAHSIIDIGYFENQTLSIKQKLYSFGLGLGLSTKAGLFRLIVANGGSENQDLDFSNSKIHISISSRF
ncbi:MAG TPA: BamA/TamA family outer membrane protein [Aequorivita sp.]|nr:BamA/TamA family outer membrane protein [Aequorivita sp.]